MPITTVANAVCPYYTMYPLDFPLGVLERHARRGQWVLDPFCGRGTTNFAARVLGLPTVGLDSSPIAVAIAKAKLVRVSPDQVVQAAAVILKRRTAPVSTPRGRFWSLAYEATTLRELCVLREALRHGPDTPTRVMLRAIVLGALHGPLTKSTPSYFSNQSPRTFAPKPDYAARFWSRKRLLPKRVPVLELIERKANHFLGDQPALVDGFVRLADSRDPKAFSSVPSFSWVITSPPYYGMRTYLSDQWIRNWFLGGPSTVDYRHPDREIVHTSPDDFAAQLSSVWRNVAKACTPGARLVCRFGAVQVRARNAVELLKASLADTPWRLVTIRDAGTALNGKRQAHQFGTRTCRPPLREYDAYAQLDT